MVSVTQDNIIGCILGTAIGDAIGLPYEGLSRRRGQRLFGDPSRHRLLFQRGMVSDDTEHTCFVAQSLIAANGDLISFQRSLAWRLRFWLLGLPAGIGFATLRSIVRLWLGVPPEHSGVFSAGNGPAMRAAIIGVAFDDLQIIRDHIRVSTRITHTDQKAEFAAFAVGLAAHMAKQQTTVSPNEYAERLKETLESDASEFLALITDATASVKAGQSTAQFADSLGLSEGVSGYSYHSVPVAIHAWLANQQDYRMAVMSIIRCGGDTDSTAAIAGGIVGISVGCAGIPEPWLHNLIEWPRSVSWMKRLGVQLANSMESETETQPIKLPVLGVLARNLFFLIVVLFHGFRRLAPPY